MSDDDVTLSERELRVMHARMLSHSLYHLKTVDGRTALTFAKHGLFKGPLKSSLPIAAVEAIENPSSAKRWDATRGPLLAFVEEPRARTSVELINLLLSPEVRVRKAALTEIARQKGKHERFLSVESEQRLEDLRAIVVADNGEEAISAAIELGDFLSDDLFFNLAGVRQCADLGLSDELRRYLRKVLRPSDRMMTCLALLPVWSPKRQDDEIRRRINRIVMCSNSITSLLDSYLRFFGHLPLSGTYSAFGAFTKWIGDQPVNDSLCDEVWRWMLDGNTPLKRYHGSQVLLGAAASLSATRQADLRRYVCDFVQRCSSEVKWKTRCSLARHYCCHLETLGPGADSERVAAMSWWLSESVCEICDGVSETSYQVVSEQITQASNASDEAWLLCRPPVSLSSLRYATLFSGSMWSVALLSELARSKLSEVSWNSDEGSEIVVQALLDPSMTPVTASDGFAFEGSLSGLCRVLSTRQLKAERVEGAAKRQRTLDNLQSLPALYDALRLLPNEEESRWIAHELRKAAMTREMADDALWDIFASKEWRRRAFIDGADVSVELICSAMSEIMFHDFEHDWQSYLPHFLALACGTAPASGDRCEMLFAYTVATSLAVDSVSGVERLLTGSDRHQYAEIVARSRERIMRVTPVVPAWIGARMRGMMAVLYVE